ncbi:SRPBCC domain-containing protein [Staphylococcus kloosii]|uniref:SRPBCC domain-containing protein n=1 Tax=Staphylococcus kloosii TaxID=29384 RepID=UPI0028A3F3F2|nr:SRPBCC domain-containing protein [Staphylococcus kloosii]MDT3959199.1 SRPBCC domain-containing protein [Staphylococcus kloosii]
MEVSYNKSNEGVTQTINTQINDHVATVFYYLSTTEGIQQWFPQLVIEERKPQGKMQFVMDETTANQTMTITDFVEDKVIGYTWDIGNVRFDLQEQDNQTRLTFTEYLPFEFPHIVLDFTGWQCQIGNVMQLIESGATLDQQQMDFEARQQRVASELNLEQ